LNARIGPPGTLYCYYLWKSINKPIRRIHILYTMCISREIKIKHRRSITSHESYTATQLHVPVKVFGNETPAAGGAARQIKINFHVVFGCGWKSFRRRRIEFVACCFVRRVYTCIPLVYACEFNKILLLWRKRKLTEQENRFGPEPRSFRDLWRRKSVFWCARASCRNIYTRRYSRCHGSNAIYGRWAYTQSTS